MRVVLLASLAMLPACGGGGDPIAGAELTWGPAGSQLFVPTEDVSGLAGDWFPCRDERCLQIDADGVRFMAEGRWVSLEGQGRLEPGETYCEGLTSGVFVYDGRWLRLSRGGRETQIIEWTIAGDAALALFLGERLRFVRIRPPRSTGPCPSVRILPIDPGG